MEGGEGGSCVTFFWGREAFVLAVSRTLCCKQSTTVPIGGGWGERSAVFGWGSEAFVLAVSKTLFSFSSQHLSRLDLGKALI